MQIPFSLGPSAVLFYYPSEGVWVIVPPFPYPRGLPTVPPSQCLEMHIPFSLGPSAVLFYYPSEGVWVIVPSLLTHHPSPPTLSWFFVLFQLLQYTIALQNVLCLLYHFRKRRTIIGWNRYKKKRKQFENIPSPSHAGVDFLQSKLWLVC